MNEEISKYLTEAMGECWHDNTHTKGNHTICNDCRITGYLTNYWWDKMKELRTDFSTWEGFGKLWEWSRNQEWWRDFAGQWEYLDSSLFTTALDEMINPETFSNSIYDFLNK